MRRCVYQPIRRFIRTSQTICLALAAAAGPAFAQGADKLSVTLNAVTASGVGNSVAEAELSDSTDGLKISVTTTGVPAGQHGFHVHENGSCDPKEKDGKMEAAGAAGGHFDPQKTGKHAGPGKGGHKGDLPLLDVSSASGAQQISIVAPDLTLKDVRGRSLMIHQGGDTYSDQPPMGGGGARIACGVIP